MKSLPGVKRWACRQLHRFKRELKLYHPLPFFRRSAPPSRGGRGTFWRGESTFWGSSLEKKILLTGAFYLLDSLINRLPPSDRPRLRTYCYQLIAATTALGVARVIRACLPIRCDSSNRVLPTPGDAIPSNGLPPRPPPGQYRPQLLSHHTTPRSPHQRSPIFTKKMRRVYRLDAHAHKL